MVGFNNVTNSYIVCYIIGGNTMENKIRILNSSDIAADLITFFKNKSLIPIVGSGISCGVPTNKGSVPSGLDYKQHMMKALLDNPQFTNEERSELKYEKFSFLCDYYEDDENVSAEHRFSYLKENFYHAGYADDDIRKSFFDIEWPYIYSLNIDDTIERSSKYNTLILPNRDFHDELFNEDLCLIKLHGDIKDIVTYKQSEKIFTSTEYALSLTKNTPLLNKLKNDYAYQNILIIGCSLDDEMDLKTLSSAAIDFHLKDTLSRTIIFIKGQPSKLQKSKFKTYGITDVVCFDSYDSMYGFISDVWKESTHIADEELEQYSNVSISRIKADEVDKNREFFFWGKGLLDLKGKKITYPYYFISRNVTETIINQLTQNKIHLVYGSRVSGKSYLLADVYSKIRDRAVIFLDGKSRLSEKAFSRLLDCKNTVVLLDIGAISREQFEKILLYSDYINKNKCNFVICINANDSDIHGIIKWKVKQNPYINSFVLRYTLNNKFEKGSEVDSINKIMPSINLPPYSYKRTLLDQLIYTEKMLKSKGRYSNIHLKINSSKQLVLLIILAIKESIYSSEIVNFALDQEIVEASKRYIPFIERIETSTFEKDPTDLSNIKYTLNSKYWLRRELGIFARNEANHPKIAEAYQYIIKCIIEISGQDEYKRRRLCRDYIMFDVMNDIFLDEYGGNLKLNLFIYSKLHNDLAGNFNFLHQEAKCHMNYAYSLKNNTERNKYLSTAREFALLSFAMISQYYENTPNENLVISMAHVQYTIATILSDLCKADGYSNGQLLQETIDAVCEALYSPYNNDDYRRERKQRASLGITNFLNYVYTNFNELPISSEERTKINGLINFLDFKKQQPKSVTNMSIKGL